MSIHELIRLHPLRGYTGHCDPETESDGDGGAQPKLRGLGFIEFSQKGIPHGSLHFPEQVKWAGHMFMFDTCAPEAAHKTNIKEPMDRVRKLDERATASSMMEWTLRSRAWCKIITLVASEFLPRKPRRKLKVPDHFQVRVSGLRIHRPMEDVQDMLWTNTFSPLIKGGHNLLSPDVRVSYCELGQLIARAKGWTIAHVTKRLRVRLYCCARVLHPNGETRTFWSTDTRYPYLKGQRRDMVEVTRPGRRIGVAQLVTFIEMENPPTRERIRWMQVSSLSQHHTRDSSHRPVCEYPLHNHCLYQWSDIGQDRCCFRGIRRISDRMWHHLPQTQRVRAMQSEIRAYYDVIEYDSILNHTNISVDPSTGHMLQTIQMI